MNLPTFLKTVAFVFATTICAHAQTLITFDDLNADTNAQIPNGYDGLDWDNFSLLNTVEELSKYGPSGYTNSVVSLSNVAVNMRGLPASFSNATPFTLDSAYLTAAWNNGLNVEVQGFVNGALTYDNTYIVNTTGPSLVNFNYAGITSVTFISSGGTPAGYTGMGEHFAMDNLTITPSPEPQAWALFGIGLLIVSWFGRKSLRARQATSL